MKFSVIIPVHNAEKTIERCIVSMFANSFNDMEVVAVEDGSSDNSWAVLHRLSDRYPRLKIYQNERNRGVSFTRNVGLDYAEGEYICFTDSDDWVEPDYLQRFADALEESPDAFPICGFINHDEKYSGRCDEYRWNGFEGVKTYPLKEKLEELFQNTLLQQLWNKSFRTEVIRTEKLRFDESISIGEDLRFILAYLEKSGLEQVSLINECKYHYMRDQEGSLMYQIGRESIEEPLKNYRQMLTLLGLSEQEIEDRLKTERARTIKLYAYLIMHNAGMKFPEKRRLIMALDPVRGKELLRHNAIVYAKEKIKRFIDGR